MNRGRLLWILVVLTCVNLSLGCASTLKPDPWVHVPVTTNPPGADLVIAGHVYQSPAIVWVPRGQGDFKISIYKKGYKPGYVMLRQSPDILWGLNIPILGHLVDMVTGAAYDLEPEVADFTLVPEEPVEPKTSGQG